MKATNKILIAAGLTAAGLAIYAALRKQAPKKVASQTTGTDPQSMIRHVMHKSKATTV